MKTSISTLAALLASIALTAASDVKAPNGGRVVEAAEPHAEFLLTPDRKVEIRFLDDAGKVVDPGSHVVTVITGDRKNPTQLAFEKSGDKLVSDKAIPEGDKLPVILQIRSAAGAKPTTDKFNLNTATCPDCELQEYACTCHEH